MFSTSTTTSLKALLEQSHCFIVRGPLRFMKARSAFSVRKNKWTRPCRCGGMLGGGRTSVLRLLPGVLAAWEPPPCLAVPLRHCSPWLHSHGPGHNRRAAHLWGVQGMGRPAACSWPEVVLWTGIWRYMFPGPDLIPTFQHLPVFWPYSNSWKFSKPPFLLLCWFLFSL